MARGRGRFGAEVKAEAESAAGLAVGDRLQKIALRRDPVRHWLCWWRPVGSSSLYPVNYNRVVRDSGLEASEFRLAMNMLLRGETIYIEGFYNRDTKVLTVCKLLV